MEAPASKSLMESLLRSRLKCLPGASELEMPNTSSHVALNELMVPFLLMLQMPTPSLESHSEQALDGDRSMACLQGICSYDAQTRFVVVDQPMRIYPRPNFS